MASDISKIKREAAGVGRALRTLYRQLEASDRKNGAASAESSGLRQRITRREAEGRQLIRQAAALGVTITIDRMGG